MSLLATIAFERIRGRYQLTSFHAAIAQLNESSGRAAEYTRLAGAAHWLGRR